MNFGVSLIDNEARTKSAKNHPGSPRTSNVETAVQTCSAIRDCWRECVQTVATPHQPEDVAQDLIAERPSV